MPNAEAKLAQGRFELRHREMLESGNRGEESRAWMFREYADKAWRAWRRALGLPEYPSSPVDSSPD